MVVEFYVDDNQLKPIALERLSDTLAKQGNPTEAATYRAQLKSEFPDWKPSGQPE